jgi:hypothetical protein
VAFDHRYVAGATTKGFDQNHNMSGITIYNSVAWDNVVNYSFYEQPDDGTHHILRNNIGFSPVNANTDLSSDTIHDHNSWNLPVTADAADFRSLAPGLAGAPRQADGSLPDNDFARLVAGSDLIDKGVDVGMPYYGSAPDLGAFEYNPGSGLVSAPQRAGGSPPNNEFGLAANSDLLDRVGTGALYYSGALVAELATLAVFLGAILTHLPKKRSQDAESL